ncbi:MAG: helix-turn-helix transcriptional regulator [bacterium]|nr:helix-turn-helix transcriptional regulator [bacterium]
MDNYGLPQKIKEARQLAGLTQTELADKISMNGKLTISRYETGERCPTIKVLVDIAKATGFNVGWFFDDPPDCQLCPEDEEVLSLFHQLNQDGRHYILECLYNATVSKRYEK